MDDEDRNPPFYEAAYRILVCSSFEGLLYTVKDSIKDICYIANDDFDKLQYKTIKSTLKLIQDDLENGGDSKQNIKECLMEWGASIRVLKKNINTLRNEYQYYKASYNETVLLIQENAYNALLHISISKNGE